MSVKFTDAQLVMMSAAAQRKDRCLSAPGTIKGAALSKVSAKLAKLGLAREIEAKPGAPIWRRDDADKVTPQIEAAGLKAVAVDEGSQDATEQVRRLSRRRSMAPVRTKAATRPGWPPARRHQVGACDRTSAARRRRDHRRFDLGYGMAAAHNTGGPHRVAQTRLCSDPRTDRRWRFGLPDLGAPAHRGDRTVRQRNAVDGRGPKQKATQAA